MISHSRDYITFKQGFTQKQFLEVVFLTGACTFFRHPGCCLGRSGLVMLMPWHSADRQTPARSLQYRAPGAAVALAGQLRRGVAATSHHALPQPATQLQFPPWQLPCAPQLTDAG